MTSKMKASQSHTMLDVRVEEHVFHLSRSRCSPALRNVCICMFVAVGVSRSTSESS